VRIGVAIPYYKPAYVYGGPVRSVSALCEGLAGAGMEVTVLTTDANGAGELEVPKATPLDLEGVRVYYYPRLYPRLAGGYYYSPGLLGALANQVKNFDVMYISATWTHSMFAARIAHSGGVPFLLSPRGSFMNWSMSQRPLKKRAYLWLIERSLINKAAAVHCTTQLEANQLRQWHFSPPVVTIPNAMDINPFLELPSRGKLRASLGIPPEGTLSLFVGRLHKMKRLDLMVRSFAPVAKKMPGAHLLIVGPEYDGSGKKAQALALELGLRDQVHFAGMLTGTDLLQAYADADLKVLVSYRENFAMVVAEAMAAGLPVLVTPEIGLAAEVVKGGAGVCVSSQSEEIAPAWMHLLANPDLRKTMGQKGRRLSKNNFSADVVAKKMLNFLSAIARQDK
jgi:glycosyltransferase involved in cell wall biosynthesis